MLVCMFFSSISQREPVCLHVFLYCHRICIIKLYPFIILLIENDRYFLGYCRRAMHRSVTNSCKKTTHLHPCKTLTAYHITLEMLAVRIQAGSRLEAKELLNASDRLQTALKEEGAHRYLKFSTTNSTSST